MPSRRQIEGLSKVTKTDLVRECFLNNTEHEISCAEAADIVLEEYRNLTGRRRFFHTDSIIRRLYQKDFLIRIRRGIYRYNPSYPLTKVGKHVFVRLYQAARRDNDYNRMELYQQILSTYDDTDSHIEWRE